MVAGHTDNLPISSFRYRSNWELSSSRAVTVVHRLTEFSELPPGRFEISGFADTQPIANNDSYEGRAKNRRVEIIIRYDRDSDAQNGTTTTAEETEPDQTAANA